MLFETSGIEISAFVPFVAGAVISFFTSMVGVSGAFLLVPFQMSVLGITSPAVSATNLVFNLVATPGGIWRFARAGRLDGRLSAMVATGTLPGLFGGWWLRTHWLADSGDFSVFVGCVLALLAAQLLLARRPAGSAAAGPHGRTRTPAVLALGLAVGVLGGVYGIGGGAIMAPVLVAAMGMPVHAVAGATLLATFVTSAVGVGVYSVLPGPAGTPFAPDWPLGLLFGAGGLIGNYGGAAAQRFVPEGVLRAGLALLVGAMAAGYLLQALLRG